MFFAAASTAMSAEKICRSCLDPLKKAALPAYAANKLSSIEQDIAGFEKRSLVTTNEEETIHELVRILKSTKSKYEAINHYVFGWSTTIEYLYRANVETARRGVEVSRIFIVSDDVLSSRNKLEALIKVMDMQNRTVSRFRTACGGTWKKTPTIIRMRFWTLASAMMPFWQR